MAESPLRNRPFGAVDDVVAMQSEDHPRLANTVLAALKRERQTMVDNLVSVRAKDYAEYLHRLGQIDGLDIAIKQTEIQAAKLG